MEHKIGEKVKIRKDLKVGNGYGKYHFSSEVTPFLGKTLTIKEIDNDDTYIMKETPWEFWTDEMLENYVINSLGDVQFGDILTLRNGERYVYAYGVIFGEERSYYCDNELVERYFRNDLTRQSKTKEYDIVKVEREGRVIYEREDIREMIVEEINKALGYEVKVVK